MEKLIFIIFIILLYVMLFLSPILLFCNLGKPHIEPFTNNYIQVFPQAGSSPLVVTFLPIYANEFIGFTIKFGDGDVYEGITSNAFVHTYKKPGVYDGAIIFSDGTVQKFTVNASD